MASLSFVFVKQCITALNIVVKRINTLFNIIFSGRISSMKPKTKDKVTGVRLPPDLLETLEVMAKAEGRSLSNMIIKVLRDALEPKAPASKA